MEAKQKILSLTAAQATREEVRARGGRVALCNGVFDLLHVGHLRYLEAARGMADALFVGVNTDRSARENKGAGRPVVPEAERAELIAGLWPVDVVLLFDEKDAGALIRALRPDLHVKGTDYSPQDVPERTLVESLGGKVVIAGDPKDHSSTALIAASRKP